MRIPRIGLLAFGMAILVALAAEADDQPPAKAESKPGVTADEGNKATAPVPSGSIDGRPTEKGALPRPLCRSTGSSFQQVRFCSFATRPPTHCACFPRRWYCHQKSTRS